MRVAGMIKPFDLNGANTGDEIPVGTLVYKKVMVRDSPNGPREAAILTGVVTKPGIVTDHGAHGKNRVRGLLPVSITRQDWSEAVYSTTKAEYVGAITRNYDTAKSTADGTGYNDQHPDGITYRVGEEVSVKKWDKSARQCSHGIHVYLTRQDAENH